MAVFKQGPRPEEHFTMISNDFARNPEIPIEAKGIYLFMRSHVDGWNMTVVRIAKAVGASKDRVSKYINILIENGYIVRDQSTGERGRFGESEYLILSSPCPENPDTDLPDTGNSRTKEDHLSSKTNGEKTIKDISPNGDVNEGSLKSSRNDYPDDFNEFWFIYPKPGRHAKKAAFNAWQKSVKTTDPSVILAGAKRYADDPNRSDAYTKWAQGWLNDGRWDDEQLPPSGPRNGSPQDSSVPAGFRKINASERRFLDGERFKSNPDPRALRALETGLVPISFGSAPQASTQPQFQGTSQSMAEINGGLS